MEKFNLRWNDFQANVTKSFGILRKEKDFFDVTLVSDDEQHISAHKVVLSSSSEFFKNILKKAQHASPLIYLSGVTEKDLSAVMDYIYHGEVQLYQEELDSFLDAAQRLKINGLTGNEETVQEDSTVTEFLSHEDEEENLDVETKLTPIKNSKAQGSIGKVLAISSSNFDAKSAVDELVEKVDGGWRCKACGKTTATRDIRRHAEIHIEGLSFDCPICQQSFRSRSKLAYHNFRHHKDN